MAWVCTPGDTQAIIFNPVDPACPLLPKPARARRPVDAHAARQKRKSHVGFSFSGRRQRRWRLTAGASTSTSAHSLSISCIATDAAV
jgi:hypothetical protein